MIANPQNCRLMIVDDNLAIHEDFRKILNPKEISTSEFDAAEAAFFGAEPPTADRRAARFQLDSAYQGEEGLSMVRKALAQQRPYAMAFVDVRMPPGWDGVETTARIWEVDPDLQVVICTAYSDCSWDSMLEQLDESDRLVILKKPFDQIEVLQLANSLTRKWQLLQESKNKLSNLEEMVELRTAQIAQEQEKFKTIFEYSPDGIFQTNAEGRYLSANPALAAIYGYASPREMMEQLTDIGAQLYVNPKQRAEFQRRMAAEKVVRAFESEVHCRDGSRKWISETACMVTRPDGSLLYYQGFVTDITAQKKAQKERELMEVQLRQAQKLESVGQLAAGIAHEMNTPLQYIGDNLRFIEESITEQHAVIAACEKLADAVQSNQVTPELMAEVQTSRKEADMPFLNEQVPLALKRSIEGVRRVSHIVSAMKEFSHPGSKEKTMVDLNRAIEATVTVACSEWKYVADLTTDFDPDLPKVLCLPSEINQVFLNLIVNAAHAIADVVKNEPGTKGLIRIRTRRIGSWVEIRISDSGAGIPEQIRDRIFDPFFTTKEVGKGTGQGLAIARSTVVDKHGGEIYFEPARDGGTDFYIRLPVFICSTNEPVKRPRA